MKADGMTVEEQLVAAMNLLEAVLKDLDPHSSWAGQVSAETLSDILKFFEVAPYPPFPERRTA